MDDKTAHSTSGDPSVDETIAQSAAVWSIRCERGPGRDEEWALRESKDADPRHAAELAGTAADWRSLDRASAIPALAAEADRIVHQARACARRRRRIVFSGALCAGAAAVVVAFVGLVKWPAAPRQTLKYQVFSSTERRMELPDGSTASLNGASHIEFDFTSNQRRVRLISGEAHFDVANDSVRPFLVSAGVVM